MAMGPDPIEQKVRRLVCLKVPVEHWALWEPGTKVQEEATAKSWAGVGAAGQVVARPKAVPQTFWQAHWVVAGQVEKSEATGAQIEGMVWPFGGVVTGVERQAEAVSHCVVEQAVVTQLWLTL